MKKRKRLGVTLAILLTATFPLFGTAYGAEGDDDGHIVWPKSQALPTFEQAKHLDVADLDNASGDEKLMLASLEGVVNRKKPRIYLIEDNPQEGKYTWLNDMKVPYDMHADPWDLVKQFKQEVKGVIVYDPNVPDSINVATTMAGLENGVVASPELAAKLKAAPYGLKVLDDLQGRFKNKLDAYTWEYEHLWPQATHRMLVGLNPTTRIHIPSGIPSQFKTLLTEQNQIRDASNRKVYDLDLSEFLGQNAVYLRFDDAFPSDGWGPAVHQVTIKADGQVIGSFIPGTADEKPYLYDSGSSAVSSGFGGHRFADNSRYFVYRFTPPAGTKQLIVSVDMWNQFKVSATNVQPPSSDKFVPYGYLRDYAVANRAMVFWLDSNVPEERDLFEKIMSDVEPGTPYLGWFDNDVAGEFNGVELTSKHGVYVLAADWFNNMTVLSGTKVPLHKQKPAAAPQLENKIYVTLTLGEGDNLQYNEHRMRQIWDDPGRGSVPLNWTTNPLLADAAPEIIGHYLDTATPNDLLIAGPSGAGYFYPTPWPDESFADFMKRSDFYMKRTGMDIVYVLNRVGAQNVPLSESEAQAYIDGMHPNGIFLSWENYFGTSILNGKLPQSIIRSVSNGQDMVNILNKAAASWDGQSPLFISLGIPAWTMSPADVAKAAAQLGPQFEIVRGDQYFDLIREANGLRQQP